MLYVIQSQVTKMTQRHLSLESKNLSLSSDSDSDQDKCNRKSPEKTQDGNEGAKTSAKHKAKSPKSPDSKSTKAVQRELTTTSTKAAAAKSGMT